MGTVHGVAKSQKDWETKQGTGYTYMYGWVPLLSTQNYHKLLIGYTPM